MGRRENSGSPGITHRLSEKTATLQSRTAPTPPDRCALNRECIRVKLGMNLIFLLRSEENSAE